MTLSEIKSIKSQADIVKVIGGLIPLSREGVNYIASCPFHNERSKSLMVNPVKNIFKCFGCGKGGDVIDFVSANKGLTCSDAAQWISDNQNIQLDSSYEPESYVEPEVSFIDYKLMKASIGYINNFTIWISEKFNNFNSDAYYIGSSKHWQGSVVFWYVDINGMVRSGKIMQYDPITGKRIKEPKQLVTWVHRVLKLKDFNLSICLFGEHLLRLRPNCPVCIVESEKSAIVASIAYPESIWLASGSLTNLTYNRCKVLEGRTITLYPDVGVEDRWQEKMDQLRDLIKADWKMMGIDSKVKGYDICDMIIDKI